MESWIRILEQGDFDLARRSTSHDAYYGWTPALIRNVISNYGNVEQRMGKHRIRFPIAPLKFTSPRADLTWFDLDKTIGEFWYDAPLDGEWSEVTFTFAVSRKKEGLDLVLNEIHVM